MELYNTLTRKKEKFKPLRNDNTKIYYCGPTVYNYAHIWNLRTYVLEDMIIKTLKFIGWYKIHTTMNLTDIEDKTIAGSQESWETLLEFTRKYTKIFLEDLDKLGIEKADNITPISDLIPEMVEMINGLIKKWYAYLWEDWSVYYDISKFKKYGKFANLDFSGMKAWARVDSDEYDKENASDFVLWKAYKESDWENFWSEKFMINWEEKTLKWRPGWHIECSACCMKHFGAQIDLHMWWEDLVFPHHQNEIAQSEAYFGKEFSKYWIHTGHLMVDWKKMSKSLWNFYTLRDLEEKFDNVKPQLLYRAIRLAFINGKYREQVNFTFEKIEAGFNTLNKLDETLKRLKQAKNTLESEINVTTQKWWKLKVKWIRREFRDEQQAFIAEFMEKLEDDFNTPEALAVLFDYQKFVNSELDTGEVSKEEVISMIDMFDTMNYVLWIMNMAIINEKEEAIPSDILEKLEARNEAKANKNFELSDKLRDELLESGYKILDTRDWARVEKI